MQINNLLSPANEVWAKVMFFPLGPGGGCLPLGPGLCLPLCDRDVPLGPAGCLPLGPGCVDKTPMDTP